MSSYHKYLTNLGYLLQQDQLSKGEITEVKRELTFKPVVYQALKSLSKPNSFLTYKQSPNYLFVPRFYGVTKFGNPDKNLLPRGNEMNSECRIDPTFGVRPHQQAAYSKTQQQLRDVGGGILSVFCGWGKTFMAIYLAVEMHKKTLVLVHKEDLFDQWRGEIMHFTAGKASIGVIQQNRIDIEGHDFVLAMLPSMSKRDYSNDIFKAFGLLIVDECHHIGSEVFSRALDKTAFRYTLGLSATPHRKDGLTTVFTNYLGPIFHVEKRAGRADTLVTRIPLASNSCYYADQYFPNGTRNTAKMVLQMVDFEERNRLITEILMRLYASQNSPEPRKTLILSKSRKHLTVIYDAIREAGVTHDNMAMKVGYYWGRSPTGINGLRENCWAPIPKITRRAKQSIFNRDSRQRCIFTQQDDSLFCVFHQYINGEDIQDYDLNIFELCQNKACHNYFIGDPGVCDICSGRKSFTGSENLAETVKSANLRKSSKIRHKEMLETSKECNIILGTNDIASEALNIPGLNTLIQATPQQEVEQTVGRILRKQSVDKNNPPLVIDFIDRCGNFPNHARVRLKTYKREGFRVTDMPRLDLDNRPFERFAWELFESTVSDHSFGRAEYDDKLAVESEAEDPPEQVKCLL